MHDGGDGGDDEEENSFSDGRHRQAHPGEADSCHHGFLYFGITLFRINDCNICRCPADVPATVTPAANRNSYRVARLVGALPRVAVFARNPGLGNRNSYRVAAACGLSICIIPHVAAACGFLVCIIPHIAAACGLLICIIPT